MKALPVLFIALALAVGVTVYFTKPGAERPPQPTTPESSTGVKDTAPREAPTSLTAPGTVARSEATAPKGLELKAPDPLPEPWMEDLRDLDRAQLSQQFLKYQAKVQEELDRLADEKIAAGESTWVKGAVGEDPRVVAERLTPPGKVGVARPGPVHKDSGTADFQWVVLDPAKHDELREGRARIAWIEQLLAKPPH